MSPIFVGNMCVFVSRPIEIVTLRKNGETPNWVVEFLRLKRHIPEKKKHGKSSRIYVCRWLKSWSAIMQCGGRMELACVVVLVEWLIILFKEEQFLLEGQTSAKKCRRFSSVTCVFLFHVQ